MFVSCNTKISSNKNYNKKKKEEEEGDRGKKMSTIQINTLRCAYHALYIRMNVKVK